jgi:hypothetical protein
VTGRVPLVAVHDGMTAQGLCRRCAGLIPAHFLTCPALRLPAGFRLGLAFFQDAPGGDEDGTRAE